MMTAPKHWRQYAAMISGDGNSVLFHLLQRSVVMALLSWLLAACSGTPPNDLGVRDGRLADCPASPNCVSSQLDDRRHHIEPFTFRDTPEQAFSRLEQLLKERSDTTIVIRQSGYLRVAFRTTLFVDDGEFLLDGRRRVIDVRSASRLGYSDLGKNRSRLEEIRREFDRAPQYPAD
jgi:uncharacterized protein (DUF1499 family)